MTILAAAFIFGIVSLVLLLLLLAIGIRDLFVIFMCDKIHKKHNLTKSERKHLVKELTSNRSSPYEED